jgi:hypothetical protein
MWAAESDVLLGGAYLTRENVETCAVVTKGSEMCEPKRRGLIDLDVSGCCRLAAAPELTTVRQLCSCAVSAWTSMMSMCWLSPSHGVSMCRGRTPPVTAIGPPTRTRPRRRHRRRLQVSQLHLLARGFFYCHFPSEGFAAAQKRLSGGDCRSTPATVTSAPPSPLAERVSPTRNAPARSTCKQRA